jgi:AraC-like DNA-binding protein
VILAKKFAQMFSRKRFREKKIKQFARKFSRKKVHHYIRENLRKNFAQNIFVKKFATIFFAIINNFTFFLSTFQGLSIGVFQENNMRSRFFWIGDFLRQLHIRYAQLTLRISNVQIFQKRETYRI